jgi:hypothetical protein
MCGEKEKERESFYALFRVSSKFIASVNEAEDRL